MNPRRLGFLLMLLVVPLAACGSLIDGRAVPQPVVADDPVLPEPSGKPAAEVPKVRRPLDASKYIADPCSSLTTAQQDEFNVTSSRVNDKTIGASCLWDVGDGAATPGVTFATNVPEGLGRLYALNETGWWDRGYFEPTEVSGYPAVYVSVSDQRARGDCGLAVGVSDELYFDATVQADAGKDACLGAMNVAEAILQTIKEGA